MLSPVKAWLEKQHWYVGFRYHPSVIPIWLKLRPSVAKTLLRQKEFYRSLLNGAKEKLVIDIGANEGFLSSIFNELGFDVLAVEPSSRNVSIMKARFSRNDGIRILQAAVSDETGKEIFFESDCDPALSTLSEKWKSIGEEREFSKKLYKASPVWIQTISLNDVLKQTGRPAFIKIDVEGYEEKVLKGLDQPVPLLSFEAILPYFMQETIACIERLSLLSADVLFSYSSNYQLAFEPFVSKEKLISSIQLLSPQTIEIFCRTS